MECKFENQIYHITYIGWLFICDEHKGKLSTKQSVLGQKKTVCLNYF